MEITHLFHQFVETASLDALEKSISSPQPFLMKANELVCDIIFESFIRILTKMCFKVLSIVKLWIYFEIKLSRICWISSVSFPFSSESLYDLISIRFLPETYAAKSLIFSEEEKKTFSEEVMSFISSIANEIQDLHRQLDQFSTHQHQDSTSTLNHLTLSPSHMKFYQQSISGLLEVSLFALYFPP
jgi:hypothetical protein